MNRREFIDAIGVGVGVAIASPGFSIAADEPAKTTAHHLPRWRGFNLLEKFTKRPAGNPPFLESDFVAMAEWEFDFARLPMSYLCWSDSSDWLKLREEELKHIDTA